MPLDFPSSPTNGQVYQQYVYDSALPGWRSKGGAVAATYTSDTAPSGAVKGDMWYRTSDGTTYVYVVDADTSQWVEIRSEISTARVGLVPIVPTSVTVSSGTGSVATDGTITFSSVGSITVNGVFGSSFSNYRTMIDGTLSTDTSLRIRMDNISTADYYWQWSRSYGSTVQPISAGADGAGFYIGSGDSNGYSALVEVFNPNKAVKTNVIFNSFGSSGSDFVYNGSGQLNLTTQTTGLTFFPSTTATLTGTMKFYGYN